MGYRDDREAMRQKVGMLEGDLARAREELERLERELRHHATKDVQDERDKERLEREVDALRRRLGEPTGTRRRGPAKGALWASLGVTAAIVAGVVGALTAMNGAPPPKPESIAVPATPEPPEKPEAELPDAPSGSPAAATPSPPPRSAVVLFGARVREVEGLPLAPGEGCHLLADLVAGPSIQRVRVLCGGRLLYDSDMPLGAGMEMRSSGVIEQAGEAVGSYAYLLHFQDEGMRSGPRAQLVADSRSRTARVQSSSAAAFTVVLELADRSAPRAGEALSEGRRGVSSDTDGPLVALARLASSEGPAPRQLARGCALSVRPSPEGQVHDCRVLLQCEDAILYGAGTSGYNDCTFEEGVPMQARDTRGEAEDGDPRMELDGNAHRVSVGDDRGAESWSMRFDLLPLSTAEIEGTWDGVALGPDGEEARVTLRVPRRGRASLAFRGANDENDDEVSLELDPVTGEVVVGPVRASLGPGFATLEGSWSREGEEAWAIALARRPEG